MLNSIYTQARQQQQTIVLPESSDRRVLQAAQIVTAKKLAKIQLLVEKPFDAPSDINLAGIDILNCAELSKKKQLRQLLIANYEKKNKNYDDDLIKQQLNSPLVLATLLLKNQTVSGCVAGAVYTTSDVLKTAFSLLGSQTNCATISGAFLMLFEKKALVFADCAVVIEPTCQQLADIAIASAQTMSTLLGKQSKVAMLSFSTLGSGKHAKSEKIAQATQLAKKIKPDLIIDGELQVDAALVPSIAEKKAANRVLSGDANVLVFPNLEAANIGYKLVERLAAAKAIGPILQGINKPMNDLSRGCSVDDIVNMVAITACQASAQQNKSKQ